MVGTHDSLNTRGVHLQQDEMELRPGQKQYSKNRKADGCRSLPWFLHSYFVQLLAAAEPQTASPYGKKSE